MTLVLDRRSQTVSSVSPRVAFAINRGGAEAPRGEVHFQDAAGLVVGFARGRVWRLRGGFGVREQHLRAAYEYLVRIDTSGYTRFTVTKVGKPS